MVVKIPKINCFIYNILSCELYKKRFKMLSYIYQTLMFFHKAFSRCLRCLTRHKISFIVISFMMKKLNDKQVK